MNTLITGMSGNCSICWTDIDPNTEVYVHDGGVHPLHPDCYIKWKVRCISDTKPITCPDCRVIREVVLPVFDRPLISTSVHPNDLPETVVALLGENIGPPFLNNLDWDNEINDWDEVRLINSYLTEYIVPEDNTAGRESINILRNYLNENVAMPGTDEAVRWVTRDFASQNTRWPMWYAIKLAAARGNYDLVTALQPVNYGMVFTYLHDIPILLAFEAFIANGWLSHAMRLLPEVRGPNIMSYRSSLERGDALLYFARTDLREGARLLLEDGPVRKRVKAINIALSHTHYSFALDVIFSPFRLRSRNSIITPV